MKRRDLLSAGAVGALLLACPWFVSFEKYPWFETYYGHNYGIEVETHVIKDFKNVVFVNHEHNHKVTIPSFHVAKDRVLSTWDVKRYPEDIDTSLTVHNALSHHVITDNLNALAHSAYDARSGALPRDVILCNLVLEAPDGFHVTRVGMGSLHTNWPVVAETA
jgi:hypothetical protein